MSSDIILCHLLDFIKYDHSNSLNYVLCCSYVSNEAPSYKTIIFLSNLLQSRGGGGGGGRMHGGCVNLISSNIKSQTDLSFDIHSF